MHKENIVKDKAILAEFVKSNPQPEDYRQKNNRVDS